VTGLAVASAGKDSGRLRSALGALLLALVGFVAVRAVVLAWLFITADHRHRLALSVLTRWDGAWYAGIAAHGYGLILTESGRVMADYAFFPLYPWTEKIASRLTGLAPAHAGLLVSAVAGVLAAAGIFAVANDVLGSRAAVVATVLWAAVPIGIVQSMAYSESVFTALAAWSLFAVLRQRWLSAAALACGAGLTRPTGAAVVAAVLVCAAYSLVVDIRRGWVRSARQSAGMRMLLDRRLAAILLAPLGTLGYLAYVDWRRRSLSGYFDVTRGWRNSFDGGASFARWVYAHLIGPQPVTGLLLLVGVGLLAFLIVACFRQRQPLPLIVYVVVLTAIALTTSGFFGSKPRYLLPAFPLLFPLAAWLSARRTAVHVAVLAGASVVAAVYGANWLLGSGPP